MRSRIAEGYANNLVPGLIECMRGGRQALGGYGSSEDNVVAFLAEIGITEGDFVEEAVRSNYIALVLKPDWWISNPDLACYEELTNARVWYHPLVHTHTHTHTHVTTTPHTHTHTHTHTSHTACTVPVVLHSFRRVAKRQSA